MHFFSFSPSVFSFSSSSKPTKSIKYAGDLIMSLFNNTPEGECHPWNLSKLNSPLNLVGKRFGGVTDSMVYVGCVHSRVYVAPRECFVNQL